MVKCWVIADPQPEPGITYLSKDLSLSRTRVDHAAKKASRHVAIRHSNTTTGLKTLHTIDPSRWDLLKQKNRKLSEHSAFQRRQQNWA